MPNPIIFTVTDAGRDAAAYAFNNLPNGKLSLTTIKVGTGQYAPQGNETALQSPLLNSFSIGGGGVQAGSGQIRFTPILASTTRIEAFEIGLFSDTGILFAVAATTSTTPLLIIEPDIDAIFSMNIAFGNVDANSIQIIVDVNAPLAIIMMGQHVAASHPHSQYKRTLDNTERLKVATAVVNDDAVCLEQLEAESTTRAGVDSALAGQIAQEALDRFNADDNLQNNKAEKSGSNAQRFKIADAVSNNEAVSKGQLDALANTVTNQQILDLIYPVGIAIEFGIYIDPNFEWPTTTWIPFAESRVTVGRQALDSQFGTVGDIGGAKSHKMTLDNLIEHDHNRNPSGFIEGVNLEANGTIEGAYEPSSGSYYISLITKTGKTGQADPTPIPTLPPYVVVAKWIRTA